MTPAQRIELAFELCVAARELAFARISQQNPGLSRTQVIEAYLQEMAVRDNLTISFR